VEFCIQTKSPGESAAQRESEGRGPQAKNQPLGEKIDSLSPKESAFRKLGKSVNMRGEKKTRRT